MNRKDLHAATALERDVLRRALPVLPSSGQTYARVTIDPTAGTRVDIGAADTLGATPEGCVERLALRPLLVGAAWKVLDLLVEAALEQSGATPDQKRGWSMERKTSAARPGIGGPESISAQAWAALTATYAATVEIRHSLVHRRAYTDASQALVGVDREGRPLRPFTATEQEAFGRAVLVAAEAALSGQSDPRTEARLERHLFHLSELHGATIETPPDAELIPEVTVLVDPALADASVYALDVPAVLAAVPFSEVKFADLVVAPRDRPGQELRGRLEDAPERVIMINLNDPPEWLS